MTLTSQVIRHEPQIKRQRACVQHHAGSPNSRMHSTPVCTRLTIRLTTNDSDDTIRTDRQWKGERKHCRSNSMLRAQARELTHLYNRNKRLDTEARIPIFMIFFHNPSYPRYWTYVSVPSISRPPGASNHPKGVPESKDMTKHGELKSYHTEDNEVRRASNPRRVRIKRNRPARERREKTSPVGRG